MWFWQWKDRAWESEIYLRNVLYTLKAYCEHRTPGHLKALEDQIKWSYEYLDKVGHGFKKDEEP